MSVASTSASSSDSWGGPALAPAPRHPRELPHPSNVVRDDWDDDDDNDDDTPEAVAASANPQKLWEEANQRAPMPQVVIASTSTSGAAALSPPPVAIQPVLRILKRSPASASSSPASGSTSPGSASTSSSARDTSASYAEREARYQAARERIFGEGGSSTSAVGPDSKATSSSSAKGGKVAAVQIAREPRGPPPDAQVDSTSTSQGGRQQGGDVRGFSSRRGKRRGGGKP
ncbi:hypothetical protein C8Q78DRAFT_1077981 [Trametes maxima]|nr:hypothetical protein C8Q78DRAFT_1077981 [Trametes maxima]